MQILNNQSIIMHNLLYYKYETQKEKIGVIIEYIDTHYRELRKQLAAEKELTSEIKAKIEEAIMEFKKVFIQQEA